MINYTDESLMPFGQFKGTKLANVPASRLIYLYETGLKPGPLRDYIEKNLDWLQREAKAQRKQERR